jgi:hypothetical protein
VAVTLKGMGSPEPNSLSMSVEEQFAKLQTPAANDHLETAVGRNFSASANGRG